MTTQKTVSLQDKAADRDAAFEAALVKKLTDLNEQKRLAVNPEGIHPKGAFNHPLEAFRKNGWLDRPLTRREASTLAKEIDPDEPATAELAGIISAARKRGETVLVWPDGSVTSWPRPPEGPTKAWHLGDAYSEARFQLERKAISALGRHDLVNSHAKYPF